MRAVSGLILVFATSAASELHAAPEPQNLITVTVSDGPYSGSYTAADPGCLHVKDRNTLGCGWKEAAAPTQVKRLEEAGIGIKHASEGPGTRDGEVVVKFLAGVDGNLLDYSVSNPRVTLTRIGPVQQISFEGRTKEGVHLRVTATLAQVDEF